MTWDASKSPGDLITSSDWNDMVSDQKGHSSRHESGGVDEIGLGGLVAADDLNVNFGTDSDFQFRFDSGNNRFELFDNVNNVDIFRVSPSSAFSFRNRNIDLNENSVTSVDLVDGVDVSNHSGRHESGGADEISHDALNNFVVNEHIDHSSVSVVAGTHLTGGGDLTSSRTLNVDETGIDATNLDGSAGTNGQFLQTDGTNLVFSEVSSGTIVQMRQLQNDQQASIARLQFENNLSELNFDGGFYDIFRDESKIVNAIQIAIKTLDGGNSEGVIELLEELGAPSNLIQTLTDSTNIVLGVSLNDSYLAVGSFDDNVYVYDTSSFSLQQTLTDSTDLVYGVSLNDSYLAVGSQDNNVYVYDTATFSLQQTLTDSTDRVQSVSLSSSYLAVGSEDNNVYVYDTSSFSLQQTLTDSTDNVQSVSLNDSYLAVGSFDNNVYVYDTATFSLQQTLTDSTDNVQSVSLSSSYLAVGSEDNSTYVYDTSSFSLQQTLTDSTDNVQSVSLNDSYLAVGSYDNSTYVYDTSSFSLQQTLTDSTDIVLGVSLNDSYLAVGGYDDNVYVYDRPSLGFSDSGSVTHIQKDLANDGFTNPAGSIVLSQEATLPPNTDISYTIEDGNGNTVTINQADVDTVVDTSNFTSTQIQLTDNLSQSTTNDDATPTLNDVMLHAEEQ